MLRKLAILGTSMTLFAAALLPAPSANAMSPAQPSMLKTSVTKAAKSYTQFMYNIPLKCQYQFFDSTQMDKPLVIQWPVKQPPAEQTPVEQPPVKQPPAKQPPASQPPAKQPPVVTPPSHPQQGTNDQLPASLTADEKQMVQLINQERQKAGLQPLQVDMRLVKVARAKAKDMIDRGYFSHTSPTYGSPFDMMRSFGVTDWQAAAENIAQNPSVTGAHQSFMNSPGHRNNIMNPSFNKVGVGILDGGPYGKTFVQMFIQSN